MSPWNFKCFKIQNVHNHVEQERIEIYRCMKTLWPGTNKQNIILGDWSPLIRNPINITKALWSFVRVVTFVTYGGHYRELVIAQRGWKKTDHLTIEIVLARPPQDKLLDSLALLCGKSIWKLDKRKAKWCISVFTFKPDISFSTVWKTSLK